MKITKVSPFSGNQNTLDLNITQSQIDRIENRFKTKELIQDIVPHLSSDEREFLISGITKEEWTKVFGRVESSN